LEAFRSEGEILHLSEIIERTGLTKARAFRLIKTLQSRGLIRRNCPRGYSLGIRPLNRRGYRLGYAAQSTEFAFSREVTNSIQRVSRREGVELVVLDNQYNSKMALRNADILIRERVDLVMEFQTDGRVAPAIASKFGALNIPLIAIEIPHPGAIYYGANNYEAGLIGGRYLGLWAKQTWRGAVDRVLLLELSKAGPLPRARITGMLDGIREVLPAFHDSQVSVLNGNGQFETSLDAVRRFLRMNRRQRTLVGAVNDPSAIGALRAFEEAGRMEDCAVMGQNASAEGRAELRRSHSRLVGSVAYFPERYGDELIPLACDILNHRNVSRATFVGHRLITPRNVDHFYPNDALVPTGADGL
jgi:ribose transport system substrate-binding protein